MVFFERGAAYTRSSFFYRGTRDYFEKEFPTGFPLIALRLMDNLHFRQ